MGNTSLVNDGEGGGQNTPPPTSPALGNTHNTTEATMPENNVLTADLHGAAHLRKRPKRLRSLLLWVVLLLIVGSGVLLWLRHDAVIDWVHSRSYQPSHGAVSLADQTTMTPYARRLFYVNYPAIEDKDAFNRDCPDASHEVAVLGCYRGNRNGIYLYHVTDERLAGITEVTAAHEMLHQAYDRLSPSERKRVNAMLQDYFTHSLTDKNIIEKMASYKKIEPDQMNNEMHSIFGTEIDHLPADLEAYYARYFTDRGKVVAFRNKYVSAFSQRQQQIDDYDKQRDELKTKIDQAQNDLDVWEAKLKAQRDHMNTLLTANQIDEYNAAVPGFNAQVAAYKAKVANTNELINEYNTLTDKRNALTAQEQELLKAQDSHASSADAE